MSSHPELSLKFTINPARENHIVHFCFKFSIPELCIRLVVIDIEFAGT